MVYINPKFADVIAQGEIRLEDVKNEVTSLKRKRIMNFWRWSELSDDIAKAENDIEQREMGLEKSAAMYLEDHDPRYASLAAVDRIDIASSDYLHELAGLRLVAYDGELEKVLAEGERVMEAATVWRETTLPSEGTVNQNAGDDERLRDISRATRDALTANEALTQAYLKGEITLVDASYAHGEIESLLGLTEMAIYHGFGFMKEARDKFRSDCVDLARKFDVADAVAARRELGGNRG